MNPPRIPFRYILAGWLGLAVLDIGQSAAGNLARGSAVSLGGLATVTLPPYLMLALLSPLVFALVRRHPLERHRLGTSAAVHAVASIAFPFLHLPLSALAVWAVTFGSIDAVPLIRRWSFVFVAIDVFRYWGLVWLYQALWYSRKARAQDVEIERLQKESAQMQAHLAEARLDSITKRLRPHFLFNTLNVISGYIVRNEPELAATLIARLSDLLRHSLRHTESTTTTLGEELAFVDAFLSLEQARFGSRLNVELHVQDGIGALEVPSFLLQPLIENATQHGLAPVADGGTLALRIWRGGDVLHIDIEDDGVGVGGSSANGGFGISSTRERLAALYGDDASFRIGPGTAGGTRVRLQLPAVERPPTQPAPAGP
jgi:two-component system, LytTR family, sensor kinase